MSDVLRFSLKLEEVPVVLEVGDGVQHYVIRELTGEDRDTYLSFMAKKLRYGDDGKASGLKSFDGIQIRLVVLSIRDDNGDKVKTSVIEQWPAKVIESLYDKAQEISGLTEVSDLGND